MLDAVQSAVAAADEMEYSSTGGACIPKSVINQYRLIPTQGLTGEAKRLAIRFNSFGSLFYFAVKVLGKSKFQLTPDVRKNLHLQMCNVVMKDGLKEVIEIPRDHYKSTVYSECFPMWRALPFTEKDELMFLKLGISLLFIEWMKRAHNQDIRLVLVSENITNAIKLGTRISQHYETNDLFKHAFPEIIPDASCTWKTETLHHKRTSKGSVQGEGTFDFAGVGSAIQSRHYDGSIQDDLVGRDALKSEKVMNDTIEYHKLLVGAMDAIHGNAGKDNDEIVVGNRWSYKDLNSHIREEENDFNFTTHSALGGCCDLHPYGTPIFPEAFSVAKLASYKKRLGSYLFSCQFLNFPINPEKVKFEKKNLRYFNFERDYNAIAQPFQSPNSQERKQYRIKIRHHVAEGDVEEDIFPRNLKRYMVVDPNHAGNTGRCRHAITVTGISTSPRRVYLLDQWARAIDINTFVQCIFRMAIAWKINTVHIEVNGAQKYLKFHLEYFVQVNKTNPDWAGIEYIQFADVKSPNTANAKTERIDSIIPITERGELWIDANNKDEFIEEYEAYGNKNGMLDVLDTLGYGPQIWQFPDMDDEALAALLAARQNRFRKAMQLT